MNRENQVDPVLTEVEVRSRIKEYFHISELVGRRTAQKHGERAWRFLDYRLLYALLIIREGLGRKMFVNRGNKRQRGLRTVVQQLVKNAFYKDRLYISAHMMGKAADFDVEGMTAQEVRNWISLNSRRFPFKIRLEGKVTWVHLDVIYEIKNSWVYIFAPPR